jgi:hypothetical protein
MVTCRLVSLSLLFLAGCHNSNTAPKDLAPDLVNPGATLHCEASGTCPSNLPFCHPDAKICVGCLDDFQTCDAKTFGPGMTCSPISHTCVPANPDAGCVRNADCPRPGFDPSPNVVCERDAGVCLQCVIDFDCVNERCDPVSHSCVPADGGT